uniref:von Willebrand factor A domain-containing protein 5B1-like n=1 Tax=Sinocyclocheilus anshuiensis TaxID=1608454 RepID=A0A671N6B8_9TELE
MPGLINKSKWSALPLSVSDITSCVRGYTLAMTASLTYENIEDHPVEGIFIYPLDEFSVVVGFEAMIGSQIITVQVKDKMKIDDCYFDCCNANGTPQSGGGHIILDEDQETTVLVVNLGVIPPLETINILVSTSSELSTLPNGGIRVSSPPVCSPRVQRSVKEEQAFSPSTQTASGVCLAALLEEETINSIDYEFNFHLEIRGPYLLAGVESPSHAIRADADPTARSATSIVVTLADKYTYDCPVEILIYPSEPHLPHVLIEDGDMTPEEYDEHLKGRSDYIKATKKDCSNEKTVDIIRKRLHKDILHNPVAMLNFCPDLRSTTSDLRSIQGEYIFLIDRSGSMSGVNINRVKDAMVVILKSLFPACLFNIVGFGSKFKTLFATSQSYDEESLALACEHVKKIRADMGGTNILAPLNWIVRQPMQRGHPRLLFLLTDGAVSNTGKVIELLRSHARFTRSEFAHSHSCICQMRFSQSKKLKRKLDKFFSFLFFYTGTDIATSPRRRAYSTNQIVDYNPMKKAYTHSDPSSVVGKNPLRRAKVQELIGQTHPDHGAQWKMDYQLASLCATSSRGRPITAHKPPAQQPEGLQEEFKVDQTHPGPVMEDGSRSSTDSPSLGSTGDADGYAHQLCEVETPQDPHAPEFKASHGKGDCKAVISGLLCGKPMRWEVAFDIQPYLKGREREEKVYEDLWNETFHHLAGRSIIQDFEHMVDKECEIEHGSGRRYQLYAIHTSKACNILSKYTVFVPIDLDSNEYLPTCIEYSHPGSSRSGSRKNRGYSVGLGRSQSGGLPGQEDAALCYSKIDDKVLTIGLFTSVFLFASSKLSLSRTRLLTKAARGFMSRSQSKISNSVGESENDNKDYIPLVSLQLSCGAFMLDSALCDAINVPMDKLKWTSPFTSHRLSLTHSEIAETPLPGSPGILRRAVQDPEGMVWATAVALAWLEHSSASYFIEWEMIAAKASMWLDEQIIPEGRDLASVKATANQLFIILRHWDENLQLNMLCYNPNSV